MKGKFGQLSIVNIVVWLILVAMGAVITPILSEFAQTAADSTNNTLTQVAANAITPLFWVGIIITFFLYVTPVRVQQY